MGRKRVVKLSKTAMIKCPFCGIRKRELIPQNMCIYFFECVKCKQKVPTPPAKCCVFCAFSNKKCAISIKEEARARGLEIRY